MPGKLGKNRAPAASLRLGFFWVSLFFLRGWAALRGFSPTQGLPEILRSNGTDGSGADASREGKGTTRQSPEPPLLFFTPPASGYFDASCGRAPQVRFNRMSPNSRRACRTNKAKGRLSVASCQLSVVGEKTAVQTKPIPRLRLSDCGFKKPAAHRLGWCGMVVQTKPICRCAGSIMQNKPNCGRGRPVGGSGAGCTNKPNCRAPGLEEADREIGVPRIVRNKANSRGRDQGPGVGDRQDCLYPRWERLYKQSQFAAGVPDKQSQLAAGGTRTAKSLPRPSPLGPGPSAGPVVQTDPIPQPCRRGQGRAVQTKPICSRAGRMATRAIVQNKANSCQDTDREIGVPRGRETKPISARWSARGRFCETNPIPGGRDRARGDAGGGAHALSLTPVVSTLLRESRCRGQRHLVQRMLTRRMSHPCAGAGVVSYFYAWDSQAGACDESAGAEL